MQIALPGAAMRTQAFAAAKPLQKSAATVCRTHRRPQWTVVDSCVARPVWYVLMGRPALLTLTAQVEHCVTRQMLQTLTIL